MIQEDCIRLTERIAEKKQLDLNVKQLKRFQKVNATISEQTNRLAEIVSSWRTLKDACPIPDNHSIAAAQLLAKVEVIASRFDEKPEWIIDERSFSSIAFGEEVSSLTSVMESSFIEAWQRYVMGKLPSANRDVLGVLSPAFPRGVALIRTISERLERARCVLPKSAQEFSSFNDDVKALSEAWVQIDGGEIPAAVLDFLRAAAEPAGATIEHLTEEVRTWLAKKKIMKSFSIRVAL